MRNGRKGEYPDLPFLWVLVAVFLYDRTVPKIGAAFPDSPTIARTGRILEASPYFHHWFCI